MAWFFVSLAAFFLFAVAVITDKFLLSKAAVVPFSFAFYIGLMGAAAGAAMYLPILIAERGFFVPRGFPLLAILVNGASQYFGLLFMFEAVNRGEVSKASPVIVSLQPVFSLLLSIALPPLLILAAGESSLDLELLSAGKLAGVLLIVAGSYLLSQAGGGKTRFDRGTWLAIVLAGFFLAFSSVAAHVAYAAFDRSYLPPGAGEAARGVMFIKAFAWGRWSILVAGVVYLLASRRFRTLFFKGPEAKKKNPARGRVAAVFLFGTGCGAAAVLLQQYAIKLGNVILVTALNGVQFFFVLALSAVLSRFFPSVLREDTSRRVILLKILWSTVLLGGIVLVVL